MTFPLSFLILQSVRITWYCIIGIILIRVLYMGIKHRNNLSRSFMIMYIIASILSGLFVISGISLDIMTLLRVKNLYYYICVGINTASSYFFLFAFCCQIYMKLTVAFIGTVYSISNRKHVLIITSLVVTVTFALLSIVLTVTKSTRYGILFVIPSLVLYNFISIYMVYAFISTLIKLINDSSRQNNSTMINAIVRYITTSIIAYTSSIILLGLCVALSQFSKYSQIGYTLVIIDGFTNLIAFYFQYNFAENDYNRYCIICHKCVLYHINKKDSTSNIDASNDIEII